jgi:modulator of FtsH protease
VEPSAIGQWHDFFAAEVQATAALVGLLFVALSLNVAQILKFSWLPVRGAQTLLILTGSLLEASVLLAPSLNPASLRAIAWACLAVSVTTWILSLLLIVSYFQRLNHHETVHTIPGHGSVLYVVTCQVAAVPPIVGALLALVGNATGYAWIAGGILSTLVFALYNSWVLLIEILR